MENKSIRVLVLDDSPRYMELIREKIMTSGYFTSLTHVITEKDFKAALQSTEYDIIIAELKLPGITVFDALRIAKRRYPLVPIICVSHSIGEEIAMELLKHGVVDYVLKSQPERLPFVIKRALEEAAEKAAHQKAIHDLKDSENRFKQLADNAQEWIWEVNTEGLYTYASPVVKNLLGYAPDELVGKKFFYDLFDPEQREELMKASWDIFSRHKTFIRFENQCVHKEGCKVMLLTSGSPVFDEKKNIMGYIGVDEDVTQQKEAEWALKTKTENFSKLLEVGLYLNQSIHKKSILQKIVNSSIDLLGLESGAIYLVHDDNLLMEAAFPVLGPNFPQEYRIAKIDNHWHIKKAVQTRSIVILEDSSQGELSEHERIIIQSSGFKTLIYLPLINEEKVIGVLILGTNNQLHTFTEEEIKLCLTLSSLSALALRNALLFENINQKVKELKNAISEKKKAEKNLELLNKAIESTSVSVIITDAKGCVIYTNPFFSEVTGYSREEVIGRNPRFLNSGSQSEAFYRDLWKTILNGDTWEGELKNRKKNGDVLWEKAVISPIMDSKGVITNFIAIKEDVSYRKQAEETRQQLEIARKTARFKQDFLAKMSHEIRTPLTGVLGMIDVLGQTALTEEQLDFISTIKSSGENLREIINQVLEYSKIEAGKVKLNPRIFEFKTLPENAKLLFENSIKPGVAIFIQMDPAIPSFIQADNFRLSQVLNNFLSNAAKFTDEGSITIVSRLMASSPDPNEILIKIEVHDTGKGIPSLLQKKLFSPFVQAEDDGGKKVNEGTGLGLSICKELAALMGGGVGLFSKEGEGSTFWFTFKAGVAEKVVPLKHDKPTVFQNKKLCILVTEDTIVIQRVVALMLKSLGHEVITANNGQQAIELYEPGKFDLILMDVQMPVMDGVTATKILKEKYKNLPPIVGLSANAFEGDQEKYLALGMDYYLAKPFHRDDFEKLVARMLQASPSK